MVKRECVEFEGSKEMCWTTQCVFRLLLRETLALFSICTGLEADKSAHSKRGFQNSVKILLFKKKIPLYFLSIICSKY